MTLLIAWLVFPIVMGLLSLGCGLTLQRAAGLELPAPVLLPAGFVVMSLAAQFPILSDSTARLATPLVVALALAGFGVSFPWRMRRIGGWWIGAAVGVFAVFAAPFVVSGRATFGGYIKLDDTATYLAMLDRAMAHGYNVAGLAPSTYEATLKTSLAFGYPLGSLLPLGVGRALVGQDAAWVWQPYLTFLAALLALCIYQLAAGVVRSPWLRAVVAFMGAQAALIYGYALWGGIKELATAMVVVLIAVLVPPTVAGNGRVRPLLPLAAAAAGSIGILSVGGVAWLALPLLGAVVLIYRSRGVAGALLAAAAFIVSTAFLAIPSIVEGFTWLSHAGGFRSGDEYGNLSRKLSWLQVFGIWPHGDFRTPPKSLDATYVVVAIAGAAAIAALAWAWRRGAWDLILAVAAAGCASAIYVFGGSPWIAGKALASSSPIVLTAAVAGVAATFELGRRVEATVAAAFLVGGVLWSNTLQYHDVFLAPNERLSELATIGNRFAGQGPTLITQYESYAARHFLRKMDPEAASELRRRFVYLRDGSVADTGVSPDVDEIRLDQILVYRTLVLPSSGAESRPPSLYNLVWRGRYYQVWQRPDQLTPILEHLSLGNRLQPAAVPACSEVLRLARLAAGTKGGLLAAAPRHPAIVIEGDGGRGIPNTYESYGENPGSLYLYGPDTVNAVIKASTQGSYGVWVGGSFRAEVEAFVDGRLVGRARNQLNWPGNFVHVGGVRLTKGVHTFRLRYLGPDWRPGSAGTPPFGLGPFVIGRETEDVPVVYVRPAQARSLCGRSLDWVEAVG